MSLNKFSITDVRKIVKAGVKGRWSDGGGLCLQINAGGGASWVFRYRAPDGTRREMGLGALHTVTLAAAREAARLARVVRHGGQDPIGHRTVAAVTFDECAEQCLTHREDAKQATTGWRPILTRYATPVLGNMSVAAITTDDVLRMVMPIWKTKTETANKLRRYTETVLTYATRVKKLRSGENPATLEALQLPSPKEVTAVESHASMLPIELPEFMRELAAVDDIAARALEFLILTVSRAGDISGQKPKTNQPAKPPVLWAHVDLDRALWVIPDPKGGVDDRNKNFEVPLSDAAVALLRALPRDGGRVFGNMGKDHMWLLLKSLRPDLTVHGFRSTFRGWAANRHLGIEDKDKLIEVTLKHAIDWEEVRKAYGRHVNYSEGRARLMQLWGEYATGAEAHKVVHLRSQ